MSAQGKQQFESQDLEVLGAEVISAATLNYISELIEEDARAALQADFATRHGSDIAEIITLLRSDQRGRLMRLLQDDLPSACLAELDESIRDEILRYLDTDVVASLVRDLESDDTLFVIEALDETEQGQIIRQMPIDEQQALRRALDYPENSAGRLMRSEFVSAPPDWTVGQAIDYLRETQDLPQDFFEIFVIDAGHTPLGSVPLSHILRTGRDVALAELLDDDFMVFDAETDREEVARLFERYNLVSAAVVDGGGAMLGAITADDIHEVIADVAGEDILRLGGVGDEVVADTMWGAAKGRLTWLVVNLATAIFASIVISAFGASIEQMVALAILMPIVASMGGNAGTQTLTVVVRGLATQELLAVNMRRAILRELGIGAVNGVALAAITATVGGVWFGDSALALVLFLAMIVNLIVAALAGILIPVSLDKLGIDPAIASAVFVTTVTDVIGFAAFLGIAGVYLL